MREMKPGDAGRGRAERPPEGALGRRLGGRRDAFLLAGGGARLVLQIRTPDPTRSGGEGAGVGEVALSSTRPPPRAPPQRPVPPPYPGSFLLLKAFSQLPSLLPGILLGCF